MIKKLLTTAFILILAAQTFAAAEVSNEAKLQYNRGVDLYRTGQFEEAASAFKQAITLDSNYIDAYYNLGVVLEQLNKKENELSSLEANLTIKEKKISEKEEKLRNKKIDELDSLIENKIDQMNDIYDDFIQNKKNLKEAEKNIENLSLAKKVNQEFKVGDFVYNKELSIQGKIKEINKNRIIFTSDDGFTLSCLKDKLEIIDPPKKPLKATHDVDKEFLNQTVLSSSLNLVGCHIDEGLNALDDYLDKCILKNLKEVRIIHGYGSGQLKTAIHNHLKNIKFVKSFRLCNELEGGGGATLVTLK